MQYQTKAEKEIILHGNVIIIKSQLAIVGLELVDVLH